MDFPAKSLKDFPNEIIGVIRKERVREAIPSVKPQNEGIPRAISGEINRRILGFFLQE